MRFAVSSNAVKSSKGSQKCETKFSKCVQLVEENVLAAQHLQPTYLLIHLADVPCCPN